MGLGGKREGAGRKKGGINTDRKNFIEIIQSIGKPGELVKKLKELADGVQCVKYDKEGLPVIYERPPDIHAITYMLDQAYGKARQTVDMNATDVPTIDNALLEIAEKRANKKRI